MGFCREFQSELESRIAFNLYFIQQVLAVGLEVVGCIVGADPCQPSETEPREPAQGALYWWATDLSSTLHVSRSGNDARAFPNHLREKIDLADVVGKISHGDNNNIAECFSNSALEGIENSWADRVLDQAELGVARGESPRRRECGVFVEVVHEKCFVRLG